MNKTSATAHERMIAANQAEYGEHATNLRWVEPSQATIAETRRAETLAVLGERIALACKQTKPHYGPLSPGCQICSQGQWSCLFINGRCNCRCFYCPTPQNDIGVPTTNLLTFPAPEAYAAYTQRFGFSGVSISGGEPLLTYERAIAYIQAVRHKLGHAPHLWLYTNGTLVTPEKLAGLKAAGLNEIRFDISAVDYNLEKARMAADHIECVTVEIPAIPEDAQRLAHLLPALSAAGVRHLNLHQLRLTPHNRTHLAQRNYTYLHGESVTVLESELAALSLLRQACDQSLPLAVNYCSFVYKRRFQKAAARRRNAQETAREHEAVTENGFIRNLTLIGDPEHIGLQAERLKRQQVPPGQWTLNTKGDRLTFHPTLWTSLDLSAGRLTVAYVEAVLTSQVSYRCAFKEVRLTQGSKLYIEKRPLRRELTLAPEDRDWFRQAIIEGTDLPVPPGSALQEEMFDFEFIRTGLQAYF